MTTCLIMWRFPLCSQRSSDLSRHGPDLLSTSYSCSIWLGSGEFGDPVNTLCPLLCSSSCSSSSVCVCQGTLSCWGAAAVRYCCCDEGVYLVNNSVWTGSVCQEVFTWMPAPKVSHQSVALWWDDQCYSRHLSVILMLWLIGVYPSSIE